MFTGIAEVFLSGYGLHEFDREEEGIQLDDVILFKSDRALGSLTINLHYALRSSPCLAQFWPHRRCAGSAGAWWFRFVSHS